jgi:signal transduction histidine kinase
MTRRLLLSYLVLAAAVLITLEVPLGILFARHERGALASDATRDATAIAALAEESLDGRHTAALGALVQHYGVGTSAEVVIADRDATILAARKGGLADDRDTTQPPQLARALSGRSVTGVARDDGRSLMVAGEPIGLPGRTRGAVLVGLPTTNVDKRVHAAWGLLTALALGVLAVAALIGWRMARWVTRPIARLSTAVADLGAGRFDTRAPDSGGPPELRDLAGRFNDMAHRLEGLVGSQRRFVADASHQLRTPLTALRLRIENLASPEPVRPESVEVALSEVDRLSRLVDGLLTLSRGEAQQPDVRATDANEIVRQRREAWAPLAQEQLVGITADTSAQAGTILVDPADLEQILDNLIANALEASSPNSTIRLAVGGDGRTVDIAVVDQGPGMSAESRARAFDRFWQGSTSPNGSAGLGLAIVQQLVDANSGRITLADAEVGGLRVSLRFPVVAVEAPPAS